MIKSSAIKNINKSKYPLISIITVVFNGEKFIENTIKSVLGQDYPNIEYIVIDGRSTDGTIKKISKYKSQLKYFLSEPDRGIYDAMNKGLIVAKGDWVNFMNAGDIFFSHKTISLVVKKIQKSAVVLFGGVEINYQEFRRIENPGLLCNIWSGMQFCHQSAFVNLRYHKKNLFDIKYRAAADLKFFYEAYKEGVAFVKLNQIISIVITGGFTESNRLNTIFDSCNAVCGRKINLRIRFFYFIQILNVNLRRIVKYFLPKSLIKKIILIK